MKNFLKLCKNYKWSVLIRAGLSEIHRIIWRQMIKGSYSQNYEDIIVDNIFNKVKGSYLEIGAYHPSRLSNTYRFYKKGWRGTVVEPNPEVIKLFKNKRKGDKFLNVGVADKNGWMDYYKFLIPALNTFSKKVIKNGHKIIGISKIKIINIKDLVKNNYDFLSLDTEGFDKIILNNWPWSICKPKVICVESEVSSILEKVGYRMVAKTKDNTIFVFGK